MILRDYQNLLVTAAREKMRYAKAVIIQLVTGGGKTPTVCSIIWSAVQRDKYVLFLAHRTELLTQASDKLRAFGVPHGLIKAGKLGDLRQPVQVASVQTLMRRIDKIAFKPDLIVIDEAHLAEAKTYKDILARFPGAYVIGLSATPGRLDGKGLGKPKGNFDAIVCGPPMTELIEQGYLVPLRYFASPAPDLSGIKISAGEYNIAQLQEIVDKPAITGDVVSHWKRIASNRKTLVFCVSIEHANHVAEQFRAAGVSALSINGKTDETVRWMAMEDFKRGAITVLVNVQLYAEGIDIPAIGCVADLAPTQSLTRYLQRAGRGMRPYPGKDDCIYLDHSSNVNRFGLPTEPREWTLEGSESKKRSTERALTVRVCPRCFAASSGRAKTCIECAHVFEVKARQDIDEREGELHEITAEEIERRRGRQEQGMTKDLKGLIEFAKIKGYKNPGFWAAKIMEGRHRKKRKKESA
jgi:DNA repair protein RadD